MDRVEARTVVMAADPGERSCGRVEIDALYTAHAARLRAVVRRRVGDPHLAEDIVQETFLRAYRFHDRLDPERPAWPWLRTIAVRLAANAVRARRFSAEEVVAEYGEYAECAEASERAVAVAVGGSASPAGPAEHAERAESRATLVAMLASLPERQRRLLVLREMYGVGYDELARAEGACVTAVRMASSRARDAIRRHEFVIHLRALAPVGWLASVVRRLRKAVAAVAEASPAGPVVVAAAAIVAAVGLSIGGGLSPAPPDRGGAGLVPPAVAPAVPVASFRAPEVGRDAPGGRATSDPTPVAGDAGAVHAVAGVAPADGDPVASPPAPQEPAGPVPGPGPGEAPPGDDGDLPYIWLPDEEDPQPPPFMTGPRTIPVVQTVCSHHPFDFRDYESVPDPCWTAANTLPAPVGTSSESPTEPVPDPSSAPEPEPDPEPPLDPTFLRV